MADLCGFQRVMRAAIHACLPQSLLEVNDAPRSLRERVCLLAALPHDCRLTEF